MDDIKIVPRKLTLKIWVQKSLKRGGGLVEYKRNDVNPDDSFLGMLDKLNHDLIMLGGNPIAFDRIQQAGGCISVNTSGNPKKPIRYR